MQSRMVDLGGPVHVVDFGGTGPTMVLVHGLGGSTQNWLAVGPALAKRARVLALDLAGFGRTPPTAGAASVPANQALLDRFLATVVSRPAILVGNSMGGLIAMMQAAADPGKVSALVLVAPAQPAPRGTRIDPQVFAAFLLYSVPGLSRWYLRQRAARLGAEGLVRQTLQLCCVDPSRVPADVRTAHIALAAERIERMPWANAAFLDAARSTLAVLRRRRGFEEMVSRIATPALVIHGTGDRLVPLRASRLLARLRPDWTLDVFEGFGHVPQLEAPERFVDSVARWLDGPGRAATG